MPGGDDPRVARAVFTLRETAGYLAAGLGAQPLGGEVNVRQVPQRVRGERREADQQRAGGVGGRPALPPRAERDVERHGGH
jgi:hypothetical protein